MINLTKMNSSLKTRIAPTPSGFLHLGNIFNFLLIKLIRDVSQGEIHLRIDDHDPDRFRREYVEDIFEQLDWLQIEWQSGPKDMQDFMTHFRSIDKMAHYQSLFIEFQMEAIDHFYVCQCSRSQIEQLTTNPCQNLKLNYQENNTTIRYLDQPNMIDVVLWRKENIASYQWMSLCEDIEHGINYIVRGEDLKESSTIQKNIAQHFSRFHSFVSCHILHHQLVKSANQEKLSKSQKASPIYLARQAGLTREHVFLQFSQWLGMPACGDWQEICKNAKLKNSTLSFF